MQADEKAQHKKLSEFAKHLDQQEKMIVTQKRKVAQMNLQHMTSIIRRQKAHNNVVEQFVDELSNMFA